MTALSVINHVLVTLSALEQVATNDHATLEAAGVYGPAAQMAARANFWDELGRVASLIDRDREFASFVADALHRDITATARPLDEDQPVSQPATPARGHGQDDTAEPTPEQKRAAALADARRMLDFLEANPELPLEGINLRIQAYTDGTNAECCAEVDRAAALLGTVAGNNGPAGWHYQTFKTFGSVSYTVVAVCKRHPIDDSAVYVDAQLRGEACHDCGALFTADSGPKFFVGSGTGSSPMFAHVTCPEGDAEPEQPDGLGDPFHDPDDRDCGCSSCLPGDPDGEYDDPDPEFLDEHALYSHSCGADGAPRCGDTEIDPVYANRPTCPTCASHLRAERRRATIPTDTGDTP